MSLKMNKKQKKEELTQDYTKRKLIIGVNEKLRNTENIKETLRELILTYK